MRTATVRRSGARPIAVCVVGSLSKSEMKKYMKGNQELKELFAVPALGWSGFWKFLDEADAGLDPASPKGSRGTDRWVISDHPGRLMRVQVF